MDYEKKYKEALERVRRLHDRMLVLSSTDALVASAELEFIFPELREIEDERIRKLLIWQVHRNIEDETNDLAQSVYDGIKGHDPDLEESIEDWKKCLAYLEKQKEQKNTSASTMAPSCWEVEQKEQKPVEPSDDELQRYQDELYDFKVFATKQAKEHHISFVHDFEWNNFCAGLLSYFNEQKPAECIEDSVKFEEGFKAGRESGLRDEQKYVLNNLDSYGLCKPAELSEEDEKRVKQLIYDTEHIRAEYEKRKKELGESFNDELIKDCDEQIAWLKAISLNHKKFNEAVEKLCSNEWSKEDEEMRNALWNLLKIQYPQDYYMTGAGIKAGKFRDWLKSLRPSWKPSEEQMKALEAATVRYQSTGLESLYEELKKL